MTFAIADEEENSDLLHEFGFDESSEEVNIGIFGPGDRKYPMEPMEEFDTDDVQQFLKQYMKGRPRCGCVYCEVFCATVLLMMSEPVQPKFSSFLVIKVLGWLLSWFC